MDFALTSTDVWGVWVDDSNNTVVKYINFEQYVLAEMTISRKN